MWQGRAMLTRFNKSIFSLIAFSYLSLTSISRSSAAPSKHESSTGKTKHASMKSDSRPSEENSHKTKKSVKNQCKSQSVAIDRNGVSKKEITLVDCKGRPKEEARKELSILLGLEDEEGETLLLDKGIISRLNTVAKQFQGKQISLVKSSTDSSKKSLHEQGKAIDIRVEDVTNFDLIQFCSTLSDTGCGFYPNASFVHFDVRKKDSGTISWIDVSEPSEKPVYASQWPTQEKKVGKPIAAMKKEKETKDVLLVQTVKNKVETASVPSKKKPSEKKTRKARYHRGD